MTAYVVISDSIINGHQSHGLHGVYLSEEHAKAVAVSTIIRETVRCSYRISTDDIIMDGLEFSYKNDVVDIYVSCIEQEVQ